MPSMATVASGTTAPTITAGREQLTRGTRSATGSWRARSSPTPPPAGARFDRQPSQELADAASLFLGEEECAGQRLKGRAEIELQPPEGLVEAVTSLGAGDRFGCRRTDANGAARRQRLEAVAKGASAPEHHCAPVDRAGQLTGERPICGGRPPPGEDPSTDDQRDGEPERGAERADDSETDRNERDGTDGAGAGGVASNAGQSKATRLRCGPGWLGQPAHPSPAAVGETERDGQVDGADGLVDVEVGEALIE